MVVYVVEAIAIVGLPFLLYCLAAFLREMGGHDSVLSTARTRGIARAISTAARKIQWLPSALGTVLCCSGALVLSVFAQTHSFKQLIPLYFLLLIAVAAVRFGWLAGIFGTVLAAAIFSVFLFEPLFSFAIQNPVAKSNLVWMCIGGLGFSELFGKGYGIVKRR